MNDITARLSNKLLAEGVKTYEFFQMLKPEQWQIPVYSEEAHWTVRELLAHFVYTEDSLGKLVDNILEGGPGAPDSFDIDRHNERGIAALQSRTTAELLPQFKILRQGMADKVFHMDDTDLTRIGRHPFLGVVALEVIIKMVYRHNQIHLRDARRAISLE